MKELSLSAINRVANQFDVLLKMIDSTEEELLRKRPETGKWSVYENLAHIGRYQEVFHDRINAIVLGKSPSFERYVAGEDPGFLTWTDLPAEKLISRFKEVRRILFRRIIELKPGEIACRGRHPVYGNMDLAWWTEFFLLHESHHLFIMFKLLASLKEQVSIPE